MSYLPIAEHGLIGDLRSAALVGTDGTVDWFCPGRFDAPSAFASVLDPERGGHWGMAPTCEVASRSQFYYPDSAVLVTRFLTEHGIAECQDFMPVGDGPQRLVRRVLNVRGEVGMRTEIAAPTMGLPEELGGERNWDYRYVWLRDAAFSLYAPLRLGFTREAGAFVGWLTDRFTEPRDDESGPLRVMYTIDGDPPPAEVELEHLDGYRGSTPVLVGNGAGDQLQLDVYGEIIDSVYLYDEYGAGISHDDWQNLCGAIDWLREHWDQPDEGIWETRGGRGDHVYLRLMCWVALERMIRMARRRGLPGDLAGWTTTRDEIYHQIMERGWDSERESFVQRYDATTLDASVLLMPMVKFVAPTEPRFLSTLRAIEEELVVDTLVFRYDAPDGIDGDEGTFSMCSFWYVEALTRAGRLPEARVALEKMFTYANHLDLYAEEIGLTGDQLGNFPQAFTHLSLISAAINLDRALG